MAERSDISKLRIAVNDPPDIIEIKRVAREAELPQEEEPQVLYFDTLREVYWQADRGSSPASYQIVRLKIGDAQLET